MKNTNLLEGLDQLFGFCKEKIPGKGEDSVCYSFHESAGVMGVFDGCGGLGAATYKKLGDHTGAYAASRLASAAVIHWFESAEDARALNLEELRTEINNILSFCMDFVDYVPPKLRGSMIRPFPTTMSLWLLTQSRNGVSAISVSAGDSRTYYLDETGLAQVSVDDIRGEDAMSNIYNDGVMTNVLSGDGNFQMSAARYEITRPCVLLAATDGCFGYVKSPMEFERLLLDTLVSARSLDHWKQNLEREIDRISGDDQSMVAAILGFGSFENLQNAMKPRLNRLNALLSGMADDRASRQQVWESYKTGYYRMAEGGIPCVG